MNISLKTIFGEVIIEGDFSCLAEAIKAALKDKKSLRSADLCSADLCSANLRSADLCYANLCYADLRYANLSYANLSYANLSYANLSSANLSSANLSSAYLSSANLCSADLRSALHRYSQIAFTGHGECGRMLTAIQLKADGPIIFFCGCFTGTEKQLRAYIADGDAHLRKTRLLALETSLTLIAAENDAAT